MNLHAHYDAYYTSDRLRQWRELGAEGKADNIIEMTDSLPRLEQVIDIGCGDGAVLARLGQAAPEWQLYGLEISRTALEGVQARDIKGLVEAQWFNGYQVPYSDQQFDLAVLSHVIEHVEHPRLLLYEAARVARYVFVEVPLEHTLRLSADYTPDAVGHINFYSDKTIRRLVQTCGLRILEARTTNTSKAMLAFQRGRKGIVQHAVRQAALNWVPGWAKQVFVYHAALLCERPSDSER